MTRLESDDFEVGQHVTILEWKPTTRQVDGGLLGMFGGGLGGGVQTITNQDRSGVGDVYLVDAVDRPFVVLRKVVSKYGHPAGQFDSKAWSVDTREATLKRLSPEYVAALVPAAPPIAGAQPS